MHERVTEAVIQSMEEYRDHLKVTDPHKKIHFTETFYEVEMGHDQLSHERDEDEYQSYHENEKVDFERMPSIMELLDYLAHRPLRDQIYMLANMLSISGFSQVEIAEALGADYQTYRNTLLNIRRDLRKRTEQ